MENNVRNEHRRVCWVWVKEKGIQPPLPIGTRMRCRVRDEIGVITGVDEHQPASFLVMPENLTEEEKASSLRWVVNFEDAVAMSLQPAEPAE